MDVFDECITIIKNTCVYECMTRLNSGDSCKT